jgi:hypothetical protein
VQFHVPMYDPRPPKVLNLAATKAAGGLERWDSEGEAMSDLLQFVANPSNSAKNRVFPLTGS